MDHIIIECPHCHDFILVYLNEVRCAIFRHAIMKTTLKQIDPHSPKHVCDELIKENKVFGCARPFRLIQGTNGWNAIPCDYI